MYKKVNLLTTALLICFSGALLLGQTTKDLLKQKFDFTRERSKETQYYKLSSELRQYSPDGLITSTEVYASYLKCEPILENEFRYTCLKFTVTQENQTKEIPSLKGWNYIYKKGIDENGFVFGIDHSKFDNMTFCDGIEVSPETSYHVYNSFIDFHSSDVFAEKTDEGNGVQNLTSLGGKIVHEATFTQPPVNLGSNVAEGSYFKNGEITLELKGLSVVNNKACALIQYDSGESSFKMIMKPMPNMEITTLGRSHYYGDFYKDLKSNWIQKVTLMETVISQTKMPEPYGNVNSVIEREILITNVNESEM